MPASMVMVPVAGRNTMRVVDWGFGFVGYMVYLRMRAELPVAEAEEGGIGGAEPVEVPEPTTPQ